MAKMNGHIYFSKRQLRLMLKGRNLGIWREGKRIVIGMKKKAKKADILKIQMKIEHLKKRLKGIR